MSDRPVRPRGNRGRRALFWFAVVFALGQQGTLLILDYLAPQVRFPIWQEHGRYLAARRTPPEILCLGSSRTGCSINDREVTACLRERVGGTVQVYNAGMSATDPAAMERVLDSLLAWELRPRLVLIELFPESVNDWNRCTQFTIERHLTWTEVADYLPAVCSSNNLGRLLRSRLFPVLNFRKQVLASLWAGPSEKPAPRSRAESYAPTEYFLTVPELQAKDNAPRERLDRLVHRVEYDLRNYRPHGPNRAALERMLARCRHEGVAVLLLSTPLASTHRARYTPAIEAAFGDYVGELSHRYGAAYADCRAVLPDDCFFDHHHPNSRGTARFSRMLGDDVLPAHWQALAGR